MYYRWSLYRVFYTALCIHVEVVNIYICIEVYTRQMQSINGASLRVLNSMIERIDLDSSFERIAFKTF